MTKKRPSFYGAEIITGLIYICSISAMLMYDICRSYAVPCTAIMTVVSFGIYMLFYALRNKKLYSTLALLGLIAAAITSSSMLFGIDAEDSYFDFIFSASEFFNPVFAAGAIFLFSVIIGFTTCYFSVYMPRPGFLLFPALVPLILASRTMGNIPTGLLIFLVIGYILAAMGCAKPEYPSDIAYFDDKKARYERLGAMGITCALAALILLILPRSSTTPYGRYLDTVIAAPQNTIYGTQQLSNFLNHANVNRGTNTPSTNILFYASADKPCYLSRWAFDTYEGEKGWGLNDTVSAYGYPNWEENQRLSSADNFIAKLQAGIKEGKLEDYREEIEKLDAVSPITSNMTITVADGSNTKVIIHPNHTVKAVIFGEDTTTYRTVKDEIFTKINLGENATYLLNYYTASPNVQFLNMLKTVDYRELIYAAAEEEVISEETKLALLTEVRNAESYKENTEEEIPEEIQALADSITAGLSSDYEKALAIEQYFGKAGFVYNLDFVPAESTAEYFLFESHTGICTDFATACVLLARAAGLPARYTEGFILEEDAKDEYGRYAVTGEYAHAYASVFIEGYGWLEVDGTKYVSQDSGKDSSAMLTIVLIAAAVLIILVIIFRKQLGELAFCVTYSFGNKKSKIRRVYLRTRKLACSIRNTDPKFTAAEEVYDIIANSLSLPDEAKAITSAANELFYGNGDPDVDTKQLFKDYKTIRRRKRSMKK